MPRSILQANINKLSMFDQGFFAIQIADPVMRVLLLFTSCLPFKSARRESRVSERHLICSRYLKSLKIVALKTW